MEPSIERCIVLRRGAASFLREETKRRLIPTRGDEASPRSPFSFPSPFSPHLLVQGEGSPPTKNRQRATDCVGNRGRAGISLFFSLFFDHRQSKSTADSRFRRYRPIVGGPCTDNFVGQPPGGAALKRATWTLSEALGPRLARALRRALKRLLQPLLRRRS
ncbi:hypothetical protein BHM03_00037135 [Ensete ventricosum]|nr:hypothetical protein BHM03_00037135 [Ensete ventricosum]